MKRQIACFAVVLGGCAAAPPPAHAPRFGVAVAGEAAALAEAGTPGAKALALADILDHRAAQLEEAASANRRDDIASLSHAYRRIALEALWPVLRRAGPESAVGVRATLEILSARDRLLLQLVYQDGATYAEAARLLGVVPNSVGPLLDRARARFAEAAARLAPDLVPAREGASNR